MGDPKKQRKKYTRPSHPWQKERIDQEKELVKEHGLKNKKELWKMVSKLKYFADRVKKLTSMSGAQEEKERLELIKKLSSLGLIKEDDSLDVVLGLAVKDILERRLQTLVYRKGFAKSVKQARQFITHQHISVKNKPITTPSYLVLASEEDKIKFIAKSNLSNPDHVERQISKPVVKEEKK